MVVEKHDIRRMDKGCVDFILLRDSDPEKAFTLYDSFHVDIMTKIALCASSIKTLEIL